MSVRATSRNFRELQVWQKAHRLTLDVYVCTSAFPRDEVFGLTSQIRRAAVSIPSNISEGCGRGGVDLSRFFRIACGSASELDYQILLPRDLGYLEHTVLNKLTQQVSEVRRMLAGYLDRINAPGTTLVADKENLPCDG